MEYFIYCYPDPQVGFADLEITGAGNTSDSSLLQSETSNENAIYLVDELEPYETLRYKKINGAEPPMMGGIAQSNGFVLTGDTVSRKTGYAYYNVNGQYEKLTGRAGFVDGYTGEGNCVRISIYADDEIVYTRDLYAGNLPEEFSIDLTGVEKLSFVMKYFIYCYPDPQVGFADIIIS